MVDDDVTSVSLRVIAKRLEQLPELIPMKPDIFRAISLVICPEVYGGRPYAPATDARPGTTEKLEIMMQRVAAGYSAISPGDRRDRHASFHADGSLPKTVWLNHEEMIDEG